MAEVTETNNITATTGRIKAIEKQIEIAYASIELPWYEVSDIVISSIDLSKRLYKISFKMNALSNSTNLDPDTIYELDVQVLEKVLPNLLCCYTNTFGALTDNFSDSIRLYIELGKQVA